jgi:hypothetical protein
VGGNEELWATEGYICSHWATKQCSNGTEIMKYIGLFRNHILALQAGVHVIKLTEFVWENRLYE